MAKASILVPRETYLKTSYSPDCDWVDGKVKERHLGEFEHANLQAVLVEFLRSRRREWEIRVLPEQRVQVSKTRYRVPDIVVIALSADRPPILVEPPIICIEILSPDDSVSELRERCKDYQQMGVPFIWLFDPIERKAWALADNGSWIAEEIELSTGPTEVPSGSITLPLKKIFELSAE
jgi:Uma2 family endonuclease